MPLQRGRTPEGSLNGGGLASGEGSVRATIEHNSRQGERLRGEEELSPLLVAQPPWAVTTYSMGRSPGW